MVEIEKAPGWDWTVTYEDDEGRQTMTVFGVLTIDEALAEARLSFLHPEEMPTFVAIERDDLPVTPPG